MATIKDVARVAGVSIATVSAVVNGTAKVSEMRTKAVWEAVKSTGYSPHGIARSLRLGRSKSIGLLVGDISNPFFTSLIRAVETRASEAGYFVIVANSDDDQEKEQNLIRHLREQRVAGLLLAPASHGKAYTETLARITDVPVVLIDRHLPDAPFDSVVVDNFGAARAATEYLLRLNHQRIGIVMGKQHLWTAEQRYQGFRSAFTHAGIEYNAELEVASEPQIESAYEATQKLLTMAQPPTAIFAMNNLMLLGSIQAVMDMGFKCPDQISLAGIDDFPWYSAIRPQLTTVAQPINELGARATEQLLFRLEESIEDKVKSPPQFISLEGRLLVRDSCIARVSNIKLQGG